MNVRETENYLIIRLTLLNLFIALIYPLMFGLLSSYLTVFLPCKIITGRITDRFVLLILELVMLCISNVICGVLFDESFMKARQFNGTVYMQTPHRLRPKYNRYFDAISMYTRFFEYCINHDISTCIGILINMIILLSCKPFPLDLFRRII